MDICIHARMVFFKDRNGYAHCVVGEHSLIQISHQFASEGFLVSMLCSAHPCGVTGYGA